MFKYILRAVFGSVLMLAASVPLTASEPSKEKAVEDGHAVKEHDEPSKMDIHAVKNDHSTMDDHAAMDDNDVPDEHSPENEHATDDAHSTTEEHAAEGEHATTDEHADDDEHAEVDEHGNKIVHYVGFETSYEPLPDGADQPWRLIRNLQLLQDQIVKGREGALENYRDALVNASSKILADSSAATWAHERNLMAVATYLLIGGDPKVGQHAFDLSNLSLVQKVPLAASIAFVQRKYVRASRLLLGINVERLPSSAKGQFALVKAMVTSSVKTEEAIGHLRQARRFAPGTLTEEAALRRLIRIAGEKAEEEKGAEVFLNHANSYFRHYGHSVYVTDFLRNYGFGIVRTPEEMGERAQEHLKSTLGRISEQHQIFLIAIVARNAVVLGRIGLGRWASDWLLEHVEGGDKLHARIELYQIATSILDPESYAESARRLKYISAEFLGKQDRSLYVAVKKMSSRIGSQPVDVEKLKELTRIEKQGFPGDEPELPFDVDEEIKVAEANPIMVRTKELFAKVDKLLGR